jgi:hypothetical protein
MSRGILRRATVDLSRRVAIVDFPPTLFTKRTVKRSPPPKTVFGLCRTKSSPFRIHTFALPTEIVHDCSSPPLSL